MQQKLLPPRLFQFGLVLMVALDVVFGPRPLAARGLELFAGIALALIGTALTIGAAGQFSRRKTNINTFLKPDQLVTDGLFQYSRNPMYLGFTCVWWVWRWRWIISSAWPLRWRSSSSLIVGTYDLKKR